MAGNTIGTSTDLVMAEAHGDMVVDQADGLHERIADGGTDEFETSIQQVLAHGI